VVVLDLVEKVAPLGDGMVVRVPVDHQEDVALARKWCDMTGNVFLSAGDGWIEVRRGRPRSAVEALSQSRRPGVRLWMYTNFDCNLACSYCCVRSSPSVARRALGHEVIARVAADAARCGVAEFYLTGGEPFILSDIGDSISACVELRPTTVLTNGMLFRGRRLQVLESLPRENLALQISLDSPTPERHDKNRGDGSWDRAVEGIRTARGLGFRVRAAATIDNSERTTEDEGLSFRAFLDELGIDRDDQLIRPLAKRGLSTTGVTLRTETMVPEVTVTADGVYWHPVGADDPDMLIDREIFPIDEHIAKVISLFEEHTQRMESAATVFPCA